MGAQPISPREKAGYSYHAASRKAVTEGGKREKESPPTAPPT